MPVSSRPISALVPGTHVPRWAEHPGSSLLRGSLHTVGRQICRAELGTLLSPNVPLRVADE